MALPPHHQQNQALYGTAGTFPGAARPQLATTLPIGSHNQFIPLQVTKKRVSANKKNHDSREFYSAAHTVAKNQLQRAQNQPSGQSQAQSEPQSSKVDQPHQYPANSNPSSSPSLAETFSTATAASHTPPRQNVPASGHTSGSASKRKHRKLAVNFEVAKVSE
uniref:5'-3' exoribonuclease 1-like n=1 Tax=Monopterus albus TaxID=43700 RepID=UPI0009B4B994|nr:5'-3' exoribonuclease 1-like [Monopterus albus]